MGFFYNSTKLETPKKKTPSRTLKQLPVGTLSKLGCSACPQESKQAPKFEPSGSNSPLVYLLRESPSEHELEHGKAFCDEAAKFIKKRIPDKMSRYVRMGYTVRCGSGSPDRAVESACCSFHLLRDIEQSKPAVVVGMGNLPLQILTGLPGGTFKWRGRMISCKIGSHSFWYLPVFDPELILSKPSKFGISEEERVFDYDMRSVMYRDVDWELEKPEFHDSDFDKGIEIITGQQPGDIQRLEKSLVEIARFPRAGIDLETSGLRPYNRDAAMYTAAVGSFDRTIAFPMDHPDGWSTANRHRAWAALGEFLVHSGVKIAHNLSFEQEWLAFFYGNSILRKTEWADTLAQAHTLCETPGTHSLDVVTREHLGFFLKDKSPVDVKRLLDYPIKEVLRYNALDTKWTCRVDQVLMGRINANENYRSEYERKVRLCPTLVMTELKGLQPDIEYAETIGQQMVEELEGIELKIERCWEVQEFKKKFKRPFSPSAPEDALVMMRDICHRQEVTKSAGNESTDESVLSSIPASEVPSAALILEHRGASKVFSTYVEPVLSGAMLFDDGKIHNKYSSMRAVTGRLAAESPNIQNWPKRKRREVRGIIAALPGKWLTSADYGQIEARVIAMASEDRNLVEAFWTNYDIHAFWAKRIWDSFPRVKDRLIKEYKIDGDDTKVLLKKLRDETKNIWVFPQFFGSNYRSCAKGLGLPDEVAQDLSEEFWDQFQGVQKWQEKLLKNYQQRLYVETLTGRRRRGNMSKNELINAPIQGTAADIVTKAMDALSERSETDEIPDLQPIFNVHDDLSFFFNDADIDPMIDIVVDEMCQHRFDFINVPLVVEVSVGKRWNEIKEIGVYRSDVLFNLENPFK